MIKLTFCLRRLPHLSREEFQRYWRETHAPLVRAAAPALRVRRYVQSHTLPHGLNETLRRGRGTPEPYDGVAELWWTVPRISRRRARPRRAARRAGGWWRTSAASSTSPAPLWVSEEHVVV